MKNKENIPLYIKEKFSELNQSDKNLKSLFTIIHHQEDRIFCEYLNKFLIENVTYTFFKSYVKKTAQYLVNNGLTNTHQYVGLLMDNSLNWIAMFWAILMIGNKPVLLNKKLPININKEIVDLLKIKTIVSDVHIEDSFAGVLYFENKNAIEQEINQLNEFIQEDWEDELVLTTTATTLNYKICVYKGEDIHYSVMNAKGILKKNNTMMVA